MAKSLPQAIQRAVDDAATLQAQVYGPQPDAPAETPAPETPEPTPAPAPVEPAPPPTPTDNWEQKYRSLQGKYDAEAPHLRRQAEAVQLQNQQLMEQLQSMQQKIAELQKAPPTPQEPPRPVVSDKDVENFGSDLIDLIQRASHAAAQRAAHDVRSDVANMLAELRGEIGKTQSTVGQVMQTQQKSERERYDDALTAAVPNWREIDATPEFRQWLSEYDPLLRTTRQNGVNAAYAAFDVPGTVAYIHAFQATQGSAAPAAPVVDERRRELERQVAPTSTAAPAPTPSSSPNTSSTIWTQAEIQNFYTDVVKGKFRNRDAEKARIENEIATAAAEGRVR
jgi:hypothetical protein